MIEKLQAIIARYDDLAKKMSCPDAMADMKTFTKMAREHKAMNELVEKSHKFLKDFEVLQENEEILSSDDEELKALVREEISDLRNSLESQEETLKILLVPKDPDDDKNTILEIRSGTGGNEAALFAGDLYRMYLRFAERNGWKMEIMSMNDNEGGGVKEVYLLEGKQLWKVS